MLSATEPMMRPMSPTERARGTAGRALRPYTDAPDPPPEPLIDAPTFITDIAMVAGVAAGTGMLARALGQPTILGYLAAGLIVGPSIPIPLFADPERIAALAEFGVVLVMFAVGLEFRVRRLLRVLPTSGFTALVQVAFLAWVGFSLGTAFGWGTTGAAVLGAALAISSTMVVTGIFRQRAVDADVQEHALGILVVQDLVAIGLITAVTALSAGKGLEPWALGQLMAQLLGVVVGMLGLGMLVVPRIVRRVVKHGGTEGIAVTAMGLAFGFALLARSFDYSVALGAFVAGVLVAESGHSEEVGHAIEPLRAVFAAIFFVSVGMEIQPGLVLVNLHLSLIVAVAVVAAQLLSVGGASLLSGNPLRRSLLTGLALGQIGEFSFILAGIGASAGVVPEAMMPVLVTVATITCFTTPWMLGRGDRIVGRLDRWMPDRAVRLLAVYQTWMERLRAGGAKQPGFRKALRNLILDWLVLVVMAAGAISLQDPAGRWIADGLRIRADVAAVLVDLCGVLLALPILVGLFRNARSLARQSARAVFPEGGGRASRAAAVLMEAIAYLALVAGVGFPALAVLRPLVRGPWGEPLVLVAMGVAVLLVWKRLGAMDAELRSGAEALALQLARHAGEEAGPIEDLSLLPGLDRVLAVSVTAGSFAVDKTLAELDLRARSGATVVAIRRSHAEVLLPTGHERLLPGDVLGLVGGPEALDRATAMLE